MNGQQRDLQKKLELIVKRYLGKYRNADTVHDVCSTVWCSDATALLAKVEVSDADRKQIEDEMLSLAKRTASKVAKQIQRSLRRHVSTSTPLGNWERAEASATIEILLKAQNQFVMDALMTEEVIDDAKRLLQRHFETGVIKTIGVLEQMNSVVELHLRDGISFASALREVQEQQGVRVSRSAGFSLWTNKVLPSLQVFCGGLARKNFVGRLDRRKKPVTRLVCGGGARSESTTE